MLLRLLPLPTKDVPTPPTVLFTLPAPVSVSTSGPSDPYAPHRLPAPPSLVAHSQTCQYNDLPCPTLLTGESSSWINTVVKEVTFLPTIGEIQVLLVDGSGVVMPLTEDDAGKMLHKVRDHVVASGKTPASGEKRFEPLPLMKRDSVSMLKSFLGSMIGGEAPATDSLVSASVAGREPTARQHRRLARATLVDCYRRWVLSGLKELLPPTYVLFSSRSLLNLELKKLSGIEGEIKVLMSIAGLSTPPSSPALSSSSTFGRSPSSSSSDSSADEMSPPTSPRPSACRLLSMDGLFGGSDDLPSVSALPAHLRTTYSKHLTAFTDLQSRIADIERLIRRHEREERRARWEIYGAEVEKSSPRMSKGSTSVKRSTKLTRSPRMGSPESHSPLMWSWTAEDVEQEVAMLNTPPLSPTESIWSTSDESSSSSSSSEDGEEDNVVIQSPSTSEKELDDLLGSYTYTYDTTMEKPPQDAGINHDASGNSTLFGLGIAFSVTPAN